MLPSVLDMEQPQRPGLKALLTGIAAGVRATNLHSGEVDKAGVAFWAVMWRQALRREACRRS